MRVRREVFNARGRDGGTVDLGIAESQFVLARCVNELYFDEAAAMFEPHRPFCPCCPIGSGDVDGIKVLVENGADCSLRDNSLRTVMCNRATALKFGPVLCPTNCKGFT